MFKLHTNTFEGTVFCCVSPGICMIINDIMLLSKNMCLKWNADTWKNYCVFNVFYKIIVIVFAIFLSNTVIFWLLGAYILLFLQHNNFVHTIRRSHGLLEKSIFRSRNLFLNFVKKKLCVYTFEASGSFILCVMSLGKVVVVFKLLTIWLCLWRSITPSNVIININRYEPVRVVYWNDQLWLSDSDVVLIRPDNGMCLKNFGIQIYRNPYIVFIQMLFVILNSSKNNCHVVLKSWSFNL